MRRGTVRWVLASFLVVLSAAFPAAGVAFASTQGHAPAQARYSNVIDQRDAEFLTVIRFANLWEMPMGDLAKERGTTEAVKTAGSVMHADHLKLNAAVEDLAERFGVQLPDQPASAHQAWMAEISGKTGKDFDRAFATRTRGAHGSVFSTIAEVRAGTYNRAILDFATQANNIVLKHMTLLEATGYVNDATGHFAEAATRTAASPENQLGASDVLLGVIAFAAVALTTVMAVRLLSTRGSTN